MVFKTFKNTQLSRPPSPNFALLSTELIRAYKKKKVGCSCTHARTPHPCITRPSRLGRVGQRKGRYNISSCTAYDHRHESRLDRYSSIYYCNTNDSDTVRERRPGVRLCNMYIIMALDYMQRGQYTGRSLSIKRIVRPHNVIHIVIIMIILHSDLFYRILRPINHPV